MPRIAVAFIVCLAFIGSAVAQDAPKQEAAKKALEPTVVPFKLSRTQHIVVRVKIDGKGPFHFVVDTGSPVLVISTEAAKKAGLASNKGLGTIKKLDFEGGLSENNVKAWIETPFQIEGMNGMGLPGIELHGMMGYTVLAKYKIEIDMSREKMVWTPLAFEPAPLERMRAKDGAVASIEMMGALVKGVAGLARLAGLKPPPPDAPRGFLGVELEQREKRVRIVSVLDDGPAAGAGLKAGDEFESIGKKAIATLAEASAAVAEVRIGQNIAISVLRGGEKIVVTMKAAPGF
jgi:serine protease Do